MRHIFTVLIFVIFLTSMSSAQESSRKQKIQELQNINQRIEQTKAQLTELEKRRLELEKFILKPTSEDFAAAEKENASAFRIFPRGLLVNKISVPGGAACYSFSTESNSYDQTPQIGLSAGFLFVMGAGGLDYGFIAYLDKLPLSQINEQTKGVAFLANYEPPTTTEEARNELMKVRRGYKVDDLIYRRTILDEVGYSYALRVINFNKADILVAFNIYRKDTDGSLIIFWKLIENFKIPRLEKNNAVINIQPNPNTENKVLDYAAQQAVQGALVQNGLDGVSVEATTTEVTLRGTVPKGKMADAVRIAQETAKRKIQNQLTEQ